MNNKGDFKMKYNIAVVAGDGIGPEVVNETIKVWFKVYD